VHKLHRRAPADREGPSLRRRLVLLVGRCVQRRACNVVLTRVYGLLVPWSAIPDSMLTVCQTFIDCRESYDADSKDVCNWFMDGIQNQGVHPSSNGPELVYAPVLVNAPRKCRHAARLTDYRIPPVHCFFFRCGLSFRNWL